MTFCPSCGAEKKEGSKFCHNCGYDFESVDSDANQNSNTDVQLNQSAGSTAQTAENSHTIAKVLGYICAILIPIIGVVFGGYLYTREEEDAKKHGKYILILSVVIWVLSILLMNS